MRSKEKGLGHDLYNLEEREGSLDRESEGAASGDTLTTSLCGAENSNDAEARNVHPI